jgi:anti-sigma B factor antagonist
VSDELMTPTPLHLTATWPDPTTAILAVAGEVDLATADQLQQGLNSILADGHARTLVVDLDGVRFLDARGLAVLLAAHRRGAHDGVTVVVTHCRPLPMRVLEVTGLDKILIDPNIAGRCPSPRPAGQRGEVKR